MKVLFIEARKPIGSRSTKELDRVPKKIHLLYTIQYKELAESLKNKLETSGHHIAAFEQVLGCSEIKPRAALLLIGSGRFHGLSIASSTKKEVFVYENGKISRISKEEIEKLNSKKKAKVNKFLSSK